LLNVAETPMGETGKDSGAIDNECCGAISTASMQEFSTQSQKDDALVAEACSCS
jgi:hypothetical protein